MELSLKYSSMAMGLLLGFVLICSVLMHVEGQQIGQCLVSCGQKVVSCSVDCGTRGGAAVPCYQQCGNESIGCVTSCFGTTFMPNDKRVI